MVLINREAALLDELGYNWLQLIVFNNSQYLEKVKKRCKFG